MDGSMYVERCRGLVPVLDAGAAEGERGRRVTPAVIAAAHEADLFRSLVPASLGGHGLGVSAICEGTRELARGCPASAWTLSFLQLHAWMLSRFPAEAHDELFGGGAVPLAAAPLAPTGRLMPVDGGAAYRVSGRWEWATGIWHSGWCLVHGFDEGVEFGTRFAVVPFADLVVEDTWHTSRMRATGSATVVLDDVVVPAHRTVAGDDLRGAVGGVAGDGLAGLPLLSVLALVSSASAVGAAQATVDHYADRLGSRVLAYSLGDKAKDQPLAQARLASVTSDLETMLAGWRAIVAELAAAGSAAGVQGEGGSDDGGSGVMDDRLRVRVRLGAAAAVRASRRIIGDVGEGAGASVYATSHPIQRLQRDVETLKGHVIFDWDRTTELAGRVLLGGHLGPTDMA